MATSNLDLKSMKGAKNEQLRRVYNTSSQGSTAQKKRGSIKKHNCLSSVARSEVCIDSRNATFRPATRRNISSTPESETVTARFSGIGPQADTYNMLKFFQKKLPLRSRRDRSVSQSIQEPHNSLPVSRRSSQPNSSRRNTSPATSPIVNRAVGNRAETQCSQEVSVQAEFKDNNNSDVLPDSEEHEYLLFLLRITEDIISQDFYSNSDIKKIFKSHVDLNKNRLNQKKMYQHINNLCKELNIDCKDYQIPDSSLATMQQRLQNTPRKHRQNVLNNEAFKNCQDCSTLRSSSFNQLHNAVEQYHALSDKSIRESSSITPSLLKLLEKISLGRVTECTESVSSCTPISSNAVMQSPERDNNCDKIPVDFDTFVRELKAQETIKEETSKTDALEPVPLEIVVPTPELKKDSPTPEIPKSPQTTVEQAATKTPSAGSQTDLETSDKEAASSCTISDKYESEFEKCSLSVASEKTQEEIQEEKKNSLMDLGNAPEKSKGNSEALVPPLDIDQKDDSKSVSSKESCLLKVLESENPSFEFTKCEDVFVRTPTSLTVINISKSNILAAKTSTSNAENIKQIPEEFKEDMLLSPKDAAEIEFRKINDLIKENPISTPPLLSPSVKSETQQAPSECPLKIILRNKIKQEDYVMVKGPLYVYKPLLEAEPKLIIFPEDQQETRLASPPVSVRSHGTFTVEHPVEYPSIDEGVQYDTSLHSIHVDNTLENMLELTRRAYTQFKDLKLLHSDYDLTPEKDEPDAGKYHHLLVDVSTAVSGHNLTGNLLLSDDYLTSRARVLEEPKVELGMGDTIDEYARFERRLLDSNYVINNRNLSTSRSVPKLKLNSGKLLSNTNFKDHRDILNKVSSDLIKFDDSPESSSIRSEGEAQILESSNSDLHWDQINL